MGKYVSFSLRMQMKWRTLDHSTLTSDSKIQFHWSTVSLCSMTQLSLVDKRLIVATRCLRNCIQFKCLVEEDTTVSSLKMARAQKLHFEPLKEADLSLYSGMC